MNTGTAIMEKGATGKVITAKAEANIIVKDMVKDTADKDKAAAEAEEEKVQEENATAKEFPSTED